MLHWLFLVALAAAAAVDLPPGVVIDHEPAHTRQYIGSPSIIRVKDAAYVASHDFFGPGSTQSHSAVSRVFRSEDRGRTWRRTAEFRDQFWSNLFVHRGTLYLMGTTYEYGRIVIRKSVDQGRTWSEPSYLTPDTNYHTAPMPIAIHEGRLWRSVEWHPPGPWGFFESLLLSAPVKADLMKPENWKLEPRRKFPTDRGVGLHWLEGNAIVDQRTGDLLNILRVANVEKAAILHRDGQVEFIDFPGGSKKFTIRWDTKTRRYWTLSNPARPQYAASQTNPASVRNTLVLMSSPDLRAWREERVILEHPDPEKHAFQYVDWQFEGDSLIVASRTAFDDEHGGAHRAHDANFLTFHRIPRFRRK